MQHIRTMTTRITIAKGDGIGPEIMDATLSALLAAGAELEFDVIVMPNLYGDVLSDVAAQIAGSVGLAGSANIGEECAMFEAIHGSAPRRAGQNMANPTGLLQGAILMLQHIGQIQIAEKIQNAWLRTIEDGVHTYDIYKEGVSTQKEGTKEFAHAIIARLDQKPQHLAAVSYPDGFSETFCTDHWRCRFKPTGIEFTKHHIVQLYQNAMNSEVDVIKLEQLYTFDGTLGYSLGQGK